MEILLLVTAVASAIAAVCSTWATYRTFQATQLTYRATDAAFRESRNAVYLQFYGLIERHHSMEITKLRREVRTKE
jgi:hypothetical protein